MRRCLRTAAYIGVVALALGGCDPKRESEEPKSQETTPVPAILPTNPQKPAPAPPPAPTPTPTPPPTPTPLPQVFVPSAKKEVSKLFSGLQIRSSVETKEGAEASVSRNDPANYAIELKVDITVPKPVATLAQLEKLNPNVGKVLPALDSMVKSGRVSPFYHALYDLKVKDIQKRLARLDLLMSNHNFYDCETILELTYPATGRKALLVQSEMDVDADGSDGDRYIEVDGSSMTYQPFTSYKWPKRTATPNQFLAGREALLKKNEAEFSRPGLTSERNKELKESIAETKREIAELRNYSFLISKTDPFIVLPGFMLPAKDYAFTPKVGDYAVVIYDGKIYPAIFGDVGPSTKMGEASLRICKELLKTANAAYRPVSDLKVSYLVFPGTAEAPFGPPDLERWKARVTELLAEFGGTGVPLETWPDLIPKPTPSPSPSPTPAEVTPTPTEVPSGY